MGNITLFADQSWIVEFSPRENCIIIATSDYHAGPLKIPAERWRAFGQCYPQSVPEGGCPPTDSANARKGEAKPQAAPAKEDGDRSGTRAVVARNEMWTVSVSRQEKRVFIECEGSPAKPLVMSRRELYRVGRSMGKKSRRSQVR